MALSGCGAANAGGSNVLIGQWHLSRQVVDPDYTGYDCTRSDLAFTANRFSWVVNGKLTVEPVSSYSPLGNNRVMVNMVREEAFTVDDNNTIEVIEGMAKCIYTRTK
jgi:hypothetical protein